MTQQVVVSGSSEQCDLDGPVRVFPTCHNRHFDAIASFFLLFILIRSMKNIADDVRHWDVTVLSAVYGGLSPTRHAAPTAAILRCHMAAILRCHMAAILQCHMAAILRCHMAAILQCHMAAILRCHMAAILVSKSAISFLMSGMLAILFCCASVRRLVSTWLYVRAYICMHTHVCVSLQTYKMYACMTCLYDLFVCCLVHKRA
jgi:hypothetical protein